jgi:hypothetical protein
MVPCLGCGRSFCRLCEPPRGAGQYCPACYQEQLERLKGKEEKSESPGRQARGKKILARLPVGKQEKPEKVEKPRSSSREKLLVPVDWIEDRATATGRRITAAAKFMAALPGRAGRFVARVARATALWAREHFPVGLAPRELLEGDPPLLATWKRLLYFVLGGAVFWVIAVAIARVRNPGFSLVVAAIVALGVVWAFGDKFGLKVAVIAAGLALVSLMLGEVTVQLLYRVGFIIKKLDLQQVGLSFLDKPRFFYRAFAYRLIVYRLLPGAVIAFLIGWWPLKMRLSWVGFKRRPVRAVKVSKAKVPVKARERARG